MILVVVSYPLSVLRKLGALRTIRTHGTVVLTEPVVLLAVHGILLSPVQTEVAPVVGPSLELAAGTSSHVVSDVMALDVTHTKRRYFVAVVMSDGRVAHGTATEGAIFLEVLRARTLAILHLLVA